ncbi:MAG: cytochrome C [Deltaproteobacteria bacterium]|nr:cytochrome C [Deltaproteobacteria bacterium]
MNYPVWELFAAGGGLLIALIAVFHVYIAHFAVGGGLFLVLTEMKGYRENSQPILDYAKKHSLFFLLLTMVAGGITGVGIWFTISLLQPSATSVMIHTFVFGWAAEWVCFVGEIVALLVYYYTFGRMERRRHLIIGWLYFIFAWLSLVLINGIITFMLTPGGWLQTGSFWSGFFNPTFVPATVFRTFLAFVFAGLFGFVTAVFVKDKEVRQSLVRYCARWVMIPFVFMILSAWWYLAALPEGPKAMIMGQNPEIIPFYNGFLIVSAVIFLGGLVMAVRMPGAVRKPVAFVLLILGLAHMGCFEWIREAGRRPFVISDFMYSNSILVSQEAGINAAGILKTARWVEHREITPGNELAAGREIFLLKCSACHSIGGPNNDIRPLTAKYTVLGMDSQLNGMGKLNTYMPRFMGTKEERWALARYIVEELNGGGPPAQEGQKAKSLPNEIPPFDKGRDEYVLLAWNNLGMHCISDSDQYWTLLPPANDLFAQLIRRAPSPTLVTEGVVLEYEVEPGFENPAGSVRFWEFADELFGLDKPLPENVGLSGNGLKGTMHLSSELEAFEASLVPVTPYPADGSFNPYPLFTITARDASTGKVLAQTRMVAPTSTEMGCKNCHGGQWRVAGVAGFTDETSADILAVHDRINRTNLLVEAKAGRPRLCQSCHHDPVLGAEGEPGVLGFPAAIHGWHANYLTDRDETACFLCHPSSATGPTGCQRGVHASLGLTCVDCHGTLEDHALSLLKREHEDGRPTAARLMANLKPRMVDSVDEINPRTPWINEPDCLTCHVDFQAPVRATAFNVWTNGLEELFRMRSDDAGIMCSACHGSTHANYPAQNMYGKNRDNIPPLQYQGDNLPIGSNRNCNLCHTEDMDFSIHHPNFMRPFRNVHLISRTN